MRLCWLLLALSFSQSTLALELYHDEYINCIIEDQKEFLQKTIQEKNEFKFFIYFDSQACNILWLTEGEKNFVEFDIEELLQKAPQNITNIINGHTHINANLGYFIKDGQNYNGEIKFADLNKIQKYKVDSNLVKEYEALAKVESLPFAQMSPPSTQDFSFLYSISDKALSLIKSSAVATSGGFWFYNIPSKNQKKFQKFLTKVDFLANVFLKANSPKISLRARQKAEKIWQMNTNKKNVRDWLNIWSQAAIDLRKPFSEKAMLEAIEHKNYKMIYFEYEQKIKSAKSFVKLLEENGAEIEFWPSLNLNSSSH